MSDLDEGKMLLAQDFHNELRSLERSGYIIPPEHQIWKKARALGYPGFGPKNREQPAQTDEDAQTEFDETANTEASQAEADPGEGSQAEADSAEDSQAEADPGEGSQAEADPAEGSTLEASNEEAAKADVSTVEDFLALGLENEAKDTDEVLPEWAGHAAKYEWNAEYGDVGPADPRLEKMLFFSEHTVRKGVEYET